MSTVASIFKEINEGIHASELEKKQQKIAKKSKTVIVSDQITG
jgi:hypothetical protein